MISDYIILISLGSYFTSGRLPLKKQLEMIMLPYNAKLIVFENDKSRSFNDKI